MPSSTNLRKLVIAGASSLLGNEVKTVLEEGPFATRDVYLVDEDEAAGRLTEAGGEAALIQRVDADTFRGAQFAFLTGSREFGRACAASAKEAGATIIDFSRASLADPDATPWFPRIEMLSGRNVARSARTFSVFSAAATAVASLALLLRRHGLRRLVVVLHQPVSEAGRHGIEELETQTSHLLSFQAVGTQVFGTQGAFNVLSRFGPEARIDLQRNALEIRAEVSAAIGDAAEDAKISLNLLHVPVFYGLTFSACADLEADVSAEQLAADCREGGFVVAQGGDAPSSVSVAGEPSIHLSEPRADSVRAHSWWFWGAADNLRVPAASGCKLAEWLEP
ncbi:MAG TPA: Asd/ArgC dimerization domain-containing protein [Candidatus Acidoferrum sp.]